ncbi:MAG: protein-L-isoaspartate O-methyltransferase family protein [Thermoplasmata archaeon]
MKGEGILKTNRVIEIMNSIDRSDFLPENIERYEDIDEPLDISYGQTQSAPHMNGIFLEISGITEEDDVLEIGTGTGYLTALIASLARSVLSIEIIKDLALFARSNIKKYNLKNVEIVNANINRMCLKNKFSLIISAASFSYKPIFLYEKLKENGRMVYPLGIYIPQSLMIYKNGEERRVGTVAFVNIID